jgi:hypothetical protein
MGDWRKEDIADSDVGKQLDAILYDKTLRPKLGIDKTAIERQKLEHARKQTPKPPVESTYKPPSDKTFFAHIIGGILATAVTGLVGYYANNHEVINADVKRIVLHILNKDEEEPVIYGNSIFYTGSFTNTNITVQSAIYIGSDKTNDYYTAISNPTNLHIYKMENLVISTNGIKGLYSAMSEVYQDFKDETNITILEENKVNGKVKRYIRDKEGNFRRQE